MEKLALYLIAAFFIIVLFLLIPRMVEFSIAVLKLLKWKGLAELYRKHFKQLVTVVRIMMVIVIILLVVFLLSG